MNFDFSFLLSIIVRQTICDLFNLLSNKELTSYRVELNIISGPGLGGAIAPIAGSVLPSEALQMLEQVPSQPAI